VVADPLAAVEAVVDDEPEAVGLVEELPHAATTRTEASPPVASQRLAGRMWGLLAFVTGRSPFTSSEYELKR
jgi:hypothetical protein